MSTLLKATALALAIGAAVGSLPTDAIAQDHRFKVWIKTFIPTNVKGSRPVPNGKGTMVSIPIAENIIGCFGTDIRNFSSSSGASARMTASVSATSYVGQYDFHNECGLTNRYTCSTGELTESGRCDSNSAIKSRYKTISQQVEEYSFDAAAGNPLVAGSPDIDFEIAVREEWASNQAIFSLSGKVDDFPAFEAYVEFDGQTKKLFDIPPKPGCGPECLLGGATRPVRGRASFGL